MGPLHYILEIEVKSTPTGGLILSQAKCVQDLLKKANMSDDHKPVYSYDRKFKILFQGWLCF